MNDGFDEEPLLEAKISYTQLFTSRTNYFIVVLITIILVVEGTILLTILETLATSSTPRQSMMYNDATHCGLSVPTARALGCHFDAISLSWTPRACWDEDLYRDMIGQFDNNITYFTMQHHPLTLSELHLSEHEQLLLTWEGYLISCTYAWKKSIRAVLTQKPLDAWSANVDLVKRCAADLMGEHQGESLQAHVPRTISFARCGLREEDLLAMVTSFS